jgi:phospholipid transport system substrate-binding protein
MIKKILSSIVLVVAFTTTLVASDTQELTQMMKKKVDFVVTTIKDKNLTKLQKDKALNESIEGLFDYTLMARLSVGKRVWHTLSSDEKQKFVKLFSDTMKKSYIAKSYMLSDEKVLVEDAKQTKRTRISVPVTIAGSKKSTQLVYKFYHSKKEIWLIYDVEIAGVSILQTYRSQYAEILKDGTISDLMKMLQDKLHSVT